MSQYGSTEYLQSSPRDLRNVIGPLPRALDHPEVPQLSERSLEEHHEISFFFLAAHDRLEGLPEVADIDEIAGLQVELVKDSGCRLRR